jgi:hypothetical protein
VRYGRRDPYGTDDAGTTRIDKGLLGPTISRTSAVDDQIKPEKRLLDSAPRRGMGDSRASAYRRLVS